MLQRIGSKKNDNKILRNKVNKRILEPKTSKERTTIKNNIDAKRVVKKSQVKNKHVKI